MVRIEVTTTTGYVLSSEVEDADFETYVNSFTAFGYNHKFVDEETGDVTYAHYPSRSIASIAITYPAQEESDGGTSTDQG